MDREERKQKKEEKKIKKALRRSRFRWFKNFCWWVMGIISCLALIAGGIFVGAKYVPIKTYTGENTENYVSSDIANKSVIDVVLTINQYKVSDIPVLMDLFDGIINSAGFGDFISVDKEKLKEVKFVYSAEENKTFASELQACMKIVATLETVGGADVLGDMGNLSVFNEWEIVSDYVEKTPKTDANGIVTNDVQEAKDYYYYDLSLKGYVRAFKEDGTWVDGISAEQKVTLYVRNPDIPKVDQNGNITKTQEGEFSSNPKLYYYIEESTGGTNALSAKPLTDNASSSNAPDSAYKRVFDDDGVRIAPASVKNIYYAKLSAVPFPEAMDMFSDSMGRLDAIEMVETMGSTIEEGGILHNILNGKKASELGEIKEGNILIKDVLNPETGNNQTTIDLIIETVNKKRATLHQQDPGNYPTVTELTLDNFTISDIAEFDTDYIKLSSVLKEDSAPDVLENVLVEATGKTEYSEIFMKDLNGFNIDNVKLKTVLNKDGGYDNKILDKLIEKNCTLGDIGDAINNLTLYEIYGEECFTTEQSEAYQDKYGYPKYKKEVQGDKITFVLDDNNGDYYIHENDGIWLILCFDVEEDDYATDGPNVGRPNKYVVSNATLQTLEKDAGAISEALRGATIRQLLDAGILSDALEDNYGSSLDEVVWRSTQN